MSAGNSGEGFHLFLPDVILLDVAMPGQSRLVALPGLRAILPNAISTATDLYIEEAFARGAEDYLEKGSRVFSGLIATIRSTRTETMIGKGLGH